MPTLDSLVPFIVETPLRTSLLTYSRHVDTSVYVKPTMLLSKSTSIIHVVIVIHLLSCRDCVVCGPLHPDRPVATLLHECFLLLAIALILSKQPCRDHDGQVSTWAAMKVRRGRRPRSFDSLKAERQAQRRVLSGTRDRSSRFNKACPRRVPFPNCEAR